MMRRIAMKPGNGFARPRYVAPPSAPARPATRRASYAGETTGKPIDKDDFVVCEAYRRLVRQMPCFRCGISGYTQFCHTDLGKGMGLKTDDRGGWPGCGLRPGPGGELIDGCHHYVGREMSREDRRAFEAEASRSTRAAVFNSGMWPIGLEMLAED